MTIIIPESLKVGDTIGIISPSAGISAIFPHRVENGIKMLKEMGFKVKIATNALKMAGYVSGSIEERIADIHEMLLDQEVKAIICTIGGNHANQLLKHINFDLMKDNPKIFIGYSDISVLHYAFLKKAGVQTFYGPCLISEFGEYPKLLEYTKKYFLKTIGGEKNIVVDNCDYYTDEILNWFTKEDLLRPRMLKKNAGFTWIKEGSAKGVIIGGCIPSINHLLGTEYWIDPVDAIFFIDIPEGHELGQGLDIASLDAYLCDLDNVGVFDKIKGLLVSVPYGYSDEQKQELEMLIKKYTKDKSYPVGLNIPIGHTQPMLTLPLMGMIEIDSNKNLIKYAI